MEVGILLFILWICYQFLTFRAASITNGVGSSQNNGYRDDLYNALIRAGNHVTAVGSLKSGTQKPDNLNQNEGHPGFKIEGVTTVAEQNVPKYLPSVITLLVGTNDMKSDDPKDQSEAPTRLCHLIDLVLQKSPGVAVLVAELPPNSDSKVNKNIDTYNKAIPQIVEQQVKKGKHVLFVQTHKLVAVSDLVDGIHPNDKAYERIGLAFYDSLKIADGKGWIIEPRTKARKPRQLFRA